MLVVYTVFKMSTPNFKPNTLFTRDNLYILRGMNSECVDLIYLDPPFNSKKNYVAPLPVKDEEILASFKDVWKLIDIDEALHEELQETQPCLYEIIKGVEAAHSKAMFSYLIYMTMRLVEMHRVLKPTGSIFLHCDPTASHYLKIVMDCIFGKSNFRNEIIWCYGETARGAKAKASQFARNNDVILFYGKTSQHLFNKTYFERKIKFEGSGYQREDDGRCFRTAPRGDYTDDSIERLRREGRIYETRNGTIRIKYHEKCDETFVYEKKLFGNVWSDIPDMMHAEEIEKTGYSTQKPLKLLQRIINTGSKKGGWVLDPFCGCATTMVAAEKLGRKWVGIDASHFAKFFVKSRMEKELEKKIPFIFLKDISGRQFSDEKELSDWENKKRMYEEQEGVCNGCVGHYHEKDMTIDHIIPTSKGGQDTQDNKQLLCFHCNTTKGTGTMPTLWQKLAKGHVLEYHEADKLIQEHKDRKKKLEKEYGTKTL